jgi:hypothetical protein
LCLAQKIVPGERISGLWDQDQDQDQEKIILLGLYHLHILVFICTVSLSSTFQSHIRNDAMHKMILSVNADAKTSKGEKLGYTTGILYLAPSNISGFQVCPTAKLAGCEKACLYTAGRGGFNNVQKARIAKTQRFFTDRESFMNDLVFSVNKVIKLARESGNIPLIRLNGTSDIRWESIPCGEHANIMEAFPDVQFYDYTKIPNRRNLPVNYDLTFSYSGLESYKPIVEKARLNSALSRIAVVFESQQAKPDQFMGLQCVDGDNTDIRHIEPHGVVVSLYAKGKAKQDFSGFVQR